MRHTLFAGLVPLLCLLARPLSAAAQHPTRFEGEAAAAVCFGTAARGAQTDATWNLVAEGRYNFARVPMDIGVQFALGAVGRDWPTGLSCDYHLKTFSLVADWNFRRTRRVSPFVGCTAGVAALRIDRSDLQQTTRTHDAAFCFMPRAGVEFFHRARLSVGYRVMRRDLRRCEIALGIVVGGGVRK